MTAGQRGTVGQHAVYARVQLPKNNFCLILNAGIKPAATSAFEIEGFRNEQRALVII